MHIDRDSWKPCNNCILENMKDCDTCKYYQLSTYQAPCISCRKLSNWERSANYCSHCGRPLTEAAWKKLEHKISV